MVAWLDHLAAVLIGSVILVVLMLMQQRTRQHTVEATVNQVVQARAHAFVRLLERDVENMRTEAQALNALGTYTCAVSRDTSGRTTAFTFPTLLDPDQGPTSPVGHVTYRLEAAGDSVRVGEAISPLFRIVREEDDGSITMTAGGSGETIVGFDVALFALRSAAPTFTCPDNLSRVRLEVQAAVEGPAQQAADQRATSRHTLTRHGFTFRPYNRTSG
ncbi:MAG: hypothetical protein HKN04_11455 [Rhodothermaceae bacterium]|nr:hypothetical protein [Rhodothermaceae bacterium]